MTAGWAPNPVFDTARAYLDAAELMYSQEENKTGFFDFQNWFVVHHLSFIATELFLKSFRVTYYYSSMSEDGPDDEKVEHAYSGHHVKFHELSTNDEKQLKKYLSAQQFELLLSISTPKAALDEVSRGRYPYEDVDGTSRFPMDSSEGHDLARTWLMLARALSRYTG